MTIDNKQINEFWLRDHRYQWRKSFLRRLFDENPYWLKASIGKDSK